MLVKDQILALCLSISLSFAFPICNSESSITLLYQNNLNGTDDVNHLSFLLLDPTPLKDASSACGTLNEKLLSKSAIQAHSADVLQSLAYVAYAGRAAPVQFYYIDNGLVSFSSFTNTLSYPTFSFWGLPLPVLCTQSSTSNQPGNSVATTANEITVASNGNNFIGFRNQKSFRFLGIPFANPVKRFTYSSPNSAKGQTFTATAYGPECPQYGSGAEDCLFLNIQTPYIPNDKDKKDLRPVLFWIYGGGFTGGSGADPLTDGGNLASREDIVVVTINYRLSTLGFLAIPGTSIKGNFGLADQITALEVFFTPLPP